MVSTCPHQRSANMLSTMSYIRDFQDGSIIHNQSGRPSSTNSTNTNSRAVPKVCLPKPECPTIDIQQRGTTEQLVDGLDRALHSRARSKAAPDAEQLIDALDRVLESCACSKAAAAAADQQDETVLCAVCYTDDVGDLIQLKCGHTYHKGFQLRSPKQAESQISSSDRIS